MSDATKAGTPPEGNPPSPDPATAPTAVTDRPMSPSSPGDGNGENGKTTVDTVREKVTLRVVVWVTFGVLCALLPFAAVWLRTALAADPVTLRELLEGGELFVISVLAGGALGELIASSTSASRDSASRRGRKLVAVLAGFGCLITFGANLMGYSLVGVSDKAMIISLSEWFFLFTLISGGVSIGMAAAE